MKNRTWVWVLIVLALLLILLITICVVSGLLFSRAGRDETGSGGIGDAIGVVYVEGVITSSTDEGVSLQSSIANAPTIISYLRQAENSPSVKAVLLHINSPGGSAVASDEIYGQLAQMSKPVIAWMDEMAASGGYYIAAAADRIIAHPDALTGSIGVITQIPNIEALLGKLGIDMMVIKSGGLKDVGSMYREMTEEEEAMWQAIINETYEHFVRAVAEGREMDPETVRQLADGRIYTGRQALELGLVDELGHRSDAVGIAARMGGIQGEPRLVEYRRPMSLLESLLGVRRSGDWSTEVLHLLNIKQAPSLQYLYVGP